MKIDKKKLLDYFKSINNFMNFKLLKCGKVLFSKQGISKNVGFYIFIIFIIFHKIVLILFYLKKLDLLLNKIKNIILAIKYLRLQKSQEKEKVIKQEEKNKEVIEMDSKDKESEIFRLRLNRININTKINNNLHNTDIFKNYKLGNDISIVNTKKNERNIRNILTEKNDTNAKMGKIQKLESLLDYNDDEINDFSYDMALENDKRNYWQFYISLIKTKHKFIYTFYYKKDYNSKIIKIDLFIFGFALNYAINGFFFDDDIMHKI